MPLPPLGNDATNYINFSSLSSMLESLYDGVVELHHVGRPFRVLAHAVFSGGGFGRVGFVLANEHYRSWVFETPRSSISRLDPLLVLFRTVRTQQEVCLAFEGLALRDPQMGGFNVNPTEIEEGVDCLPSFQVELLRRVEAVLVTERVEREIAANDQISLHHIIAAHAAERAREEMGVWIVSTPEPEPVRISVWEKLGL